MPDIRVALWIAVAVAVFVGGMELKELTGPKSVTLLDLMRTGVSSDAPPCPERCLPGHDRGRASTGEPIPCPLACSSDQQPAQAVAPVVDWQHMTVGSASTHRKAEEGR
jgi:hypothetical protein